MLSPPALLSPPTLLASYDDPLLASCDDGKREAPLPRWLAFGSFGVGSLGVGCWLVSCEGRRARPGGGVPFARGLDMAMAGAGAGRAAVPSRVGRRLLSHELTREPVTEEGWEEEGVVDGVSSSHSSYREAYGCCRRSSARSAHCWKARSFQVRRLR